MFICCNLVIRLRAMTRLYGERVHSATRVRIACLCPGLWMWRRLRDLLAIFVVRSIFLQGRVHRPWRNSSERASGESALDRGRCRRGLGELGGGGGGGRREGTYLGVGVRQPPAT